MCIYISKLGKRIFVLFIFSLFSSFCLNMYYWEKIEEFCVFPHSTGTLKYFDLILKSESVLVSLFSCIILSIMTHVSTSRTVMMN